MVRIAAIVDCYTVEPSGLGVPPYLVHVRPCRLRRADDAFPGAECGT